MNFDLEKIATDLNHVTDIPSIEELMDDDIFSISNYPHYETVLSNWFAYFFHSENQNESSELFAEIFSVLLAEKGIRSISDFDWLNNDISCKTEYYTTKGNYIDLVVYDFENEDGSYVNSLVIEHKVFASVYNDLQDYFKSIKCDEDKIGIVLSANPANYKNDNFINITYTDFLNVFEKSFGKYLLRMDSKEIFYLKEFTNNLKRMTNTEDLKAFDFALKNGSKIANIATFKTAIENSFINSIRLHTIPEGILFHRKNPKSISFSSLDGNLVIYTEVRDIVWNKKCPAQIWLQHEPANKWKSLSDYSAIKKELPKYSFQNNKHGDKWIEIFRTEFLFDEDLNDIEKIKDDFYEMLAQVFNNIESMVKKYLG